MNTVKIYRLTHLSPTLFQRMKAARLEAAQVWNQCCQLHKEARRCHSKWPGQTDLREATKGRFALHSQSVQAIVQTFLANVDATRTLRRSNRKIKYPYKMKRFYAVMWPAQAISRERGRVVLPMGRGRASLVLPLDIPPESGACTLVWNNGFELHVCLAVSRTATAPGENRATVDLGEIHLAAVTTNTGAALVVSGRGIRSLKQQRNMQQGRLARKQARCKKYSRRWKKLQRAKNRMSGRIRRRVRDLRHKATRQAIEFCRVHQVGTLYIGEPHGVRQHKTGRHHHQRMSQWEYGKDIEYLTYKCLQASIKSFTGTERGTSSQCPVCGRLRKKPKGPVWRCKQCGFQGHRDLVGSVNMHRIAYGHKIMFPHIYLRPSRMRRAAVNENPAVGRSSRAGTPPSCLSESMRQPPLSERVPPGTGHTREIAEKLIPDSGSESVI
jgi:putative transposase